MFMLLQDEAPTHSPSPPPSSLEIPAEQLFSVSWREWRWGGVLWQPCCLCRSCALAGVPIGLLAPLLLRLLQAFYRISPTGSGSNPYAAAAPAGFPPPQHNPFAAVPTTEAVRGQLGGMSVGGSGAGAAALRRCMLCLPQQCQLATAHT